MLVGRHVRWTVERHARAERRGFRGLLVDDARAWLAGYHDPFSGGHAALTEEGQRAEGEPDELRGRPEARRRRHVAGAPARRAVGEGPARGRERGGEIW